MDFFLVKMSTNPTEIAPISQNMLYPEISGKEGIFFIITRAFIPMLPALS